MLWTDPVIDQSNFPNQRKAVKSLKGNYSLEGKAVAPAFRKGDLLETCALIYTTTGGLICKEILKPPPYFQYWSTLKLIRDKKHQEIKIEPQFVTSKKREPGVATMTEKTHELFDLTSIDESDDDELEFTGSTGKNGLPMKAEEFAEKFKPYFSSSENWDVKKMQRKIRKMNTTVVSYAEIDQNQIDVSQVEDFEQDTKNQATKRASVKVIASSCGNKCFKVKKIRIEEDYVYG